MGVVELSYIPTPEEVSSIPGLSHLAPNFPIKQEWPTILLLGRDCMKAQPQTQLTWSKDKSQLAVKTPLGWVIMGKPSQSTRPLQTTNIPHAQNSNNDNDNDHDHDHNNNNNNNNN